MFCFLSELGFPFVVDFPNIVSYKCARTMVEPVTLGSPPCSPSPGQSNQYLPAYLIGDQCGNTTPRLWSTVGTPTKARVSTSLSSSTPGIYSPATARTGFGKTSLSIRNQGDITARNLLGCQPTDKAGGPPVQGLSDTLGTPQSQISAISRVPCTLFSSSPEGQIRNAKILTPNKGMNQAQASKLLTSPAQIDPFYTQGDSLSPDEELDGTWVTVFGYPSASASYILQQFSLYGTVVEHQVSACGNWMHIHYQSKLQAKKALSKNGKVFGGSIMVGVKLCIQKKLMDTSTKENSMLEMSTSSFQKNETLIKSSRIANIRPLAQAYKTAVSDYEVVTQSQTPQKTNNFISKAMEYIFGW
ncbi:nucleoporin NUP35-like isoform X2 [Tachypleus tridentatus]|uniref:nucleoporin NUP35-like isoform X2 n=1 Tax=Tachypleus tridentatus TaxID=6853 RepID=UPI003FCFECAF